MPKNTLLSALPAGAGVWILAGGVGLVAFLSILIASFVSMRSQAKAELCGVHLLQIYRSIRSGDLLDSPRWDAAGTGRSFLENPRAWPTRQPIPYETWCPVRGPSRDIDYRGPARLLRLMKGDEPILADRPGNHGPGQGGNVMLKSGSVAPAGPEDPLWKQAAQSTSD